MSGTIPPPRHLRSNSSQVDSAQSSTRSRRHRQVSHDWISGEPSTIGQRSATLAGTTRDNSRREKIVKPKFSSSSTSNLPLRSAPLTRAPIRVENSTGEASGKHQPVPSIFSKSVSSFVSAESIPLPSYQVASANRSGDGEELEYVDFIASTQQRRSKHGGSINRARLVVAIDFGTTYSGVSYAVVHPNEDPEDVKPYVVHNWEGRLPGKSTSHKVPSLIAYDENDNDRIHWGFDIPDHLEDCTFRFVKLLLEPAASRKVAGLTEVIDPESTEKQLLSVQKLAVKVAADYVKALWQHAKTQIINHISQAAFDYADKSIVMTVPAVWSDRAKHNTYMIAVGAGLAGDDYFLSVVSEPEAAAIAVLKDRTRATGLQKEDVYLVADCGGGTVDLTSYQVSKVSPLTIEEVVPGDGDVCGATFLEANFRKLLRTYLGQTVMDDLDPERERLIICSFEDSIRARFTGEESRRHTLVAPGIPDDASVKIKGGLMQFTAAEIKPVFTPVVEKVERLIRKQISALARKNLRPKAIVLVGGLGSNIYLARQLRQRYETINEDMPTSSITSMSDLPIVIQQPDTSWEAVSTGAVRCEVLGLGSLISLRIARYNVGFVGKSKWEEGKYLPKQKHKHPFYGELYARDTISWVLRRGDSMPSDRTVDFERIGCEWEDEIGPTNSSKRAAGKRTSFSVAFVASPEDNAPAYHTPRTHDFATLKVHWDLKKFPKGTMPLREGPAPGKRKFREFCFTLHMQQDAAGMKFSYSVNGTFVSDIYNVDFHMLPDEVGGSETDSAVGGVVNA